MKKITLALCIACSLVSFSPNLRAQWSSDPMTNLPVAVKPSDQVQPKIRPTPDGGCYISWFDNDPNGRPPFGYDVYLQRLSEKGYVRWHDKGLRLADLGMSSTQDYGLDVDDEGNALLAFLDDRASSADVVTAVKVSKQGVPLWGRNGKHPGLGSDFKGNPKITATSDGFVVVGWINGNNLTFQRYDSAGNAQWGAAGITVAAPNGFTYSLADLHRGDNGTAIFSFVSAAGFTSPKHLLANKLSTSGTLLWGANHVAVFDGGSLQFGNFPSFVPDDAGGAVFGWYQVDPLQSRAQHILANGMEAFPHNGVPGSTNTGDDQVNPSISYDPATGSTYLAWDEILPGPLTNEGISAQRFDPAGNALWGPTGVVVQPFTSSAVINVTSVFMEAGFLVVWSSEPNFGQDTIMASKLDSNGALTCSPFAVSSIVSSKSRLDLALSSTGRALAVWSDGRVDAGDIYAQDINPDCSLGQ
jgi:hypothetical protein